MKKIILFISILSVIFQKDYNTNVLIDKVYFSNQNLNRQVFCNVYYNFKKDSLYVLNAKGFQRLKFRVSYHKDEIVLNNKFIKNYKLKMLNNDESIILLDKSNKISHNDTIKLNRVNIGKLDHQLLKNPNPSIWEAEVKRNKEIDTIYLGFEKFDFQKNITHYYFYRTGMTPFDSSFKVDNISKELNLVILDGVYYLITNFTDKLITFVSTSCSNSDTRVTSFEKLDLKKNKINLSGIWTKIKSQGYVELPNKIKFDKNYIYLDKEKLKYYTALNGKLLHLGKYKSSYNSRDLQLSRHNNFEIKKFNKDTLTLNYTIYHERCSITYFRIR